MFARTTRQASAFTSVRGTVFSTPVQTGSLLPGNVGTIPAPVLNARIRKAWLHGAKVGLVGEADGAGRSSTPLLSCQGGTGFAAGTSSGRAIL